MLLCRELKQFTDAVVAIDGRKFKAVNKRKRNFAPGKIEHRERELEESSQRYLYALVTADQTQPVEMQAKTERLQGKIQKMRQRLHDLQFVKVQLDSFTSPPTTSTNALRVSGRSIASAETGWTTNQHPLVQCVPWLCHEGAMHYKQLPTHLAMG